MFLLNEVTGCNVKVEHRNSPLKCFTKLFLFDYFYSFRNESRQLLKSLVDLTFNSFLTSKIAPTNSHLKMNSSSLLINFKNSISLALIGNYSLWQIWRCETNFTPFDRFQWIYDWLQVNKMNLSIDGSYQQVDSSTRKLSRILKQKKYKCWRQKSFNIAIAKIRVLFLLF